MAKNAYAMAFGILQRLAPRINANILDLLEEDAAGPAVPETSHFENQFTHVEYRERQEDP